MTEIRYPPPPKPKWHENPTHPIYGLMLVILLMIGAVWLSSKNAENFDETEFAMLRELAMYAAAVVFGGGKLVNWLNRGK